MNQAPHQIAEIQKPGRSGNQLDSHETGQQLVNYDGQLACAKELQAYCQDQVGLEWVPEGINDAEENDSWHNQSLKKNKSAISDHSIAVGHGSILHARMRNSDRNLSHQESESLAACFDEKKSGKKSC